LFGKEGKKKGVLLEKAPNWGEKKRICEGPPHKIRGVPKKPGPKKPKKGALG